ncbi:hypothetical protein D7V21_16200 [Acinetobacter guerrae]|uniref:Uncharacterized protein n=1 Tax=Acinetobacter guerrae TaxID=1843371 RepID=A0A3A8EPH3_9GAMM|nr:hypothetical protein [Acinetobacter guerrae]RKG30283.1 hypothetical protein D7V21_16200 [Acinetobacter guerrae]
MGDMKDFAFQGKIYLGENVNGKPRNLKWVGDQSSLNFALAIEKEERKENYTGTKGTSVINIQSKAVNPELVLRYLTPENILLGVHGKLNKVAAGTVTAEVLPSDLVAGELVKLDKANISNLVLTDSTPSTPKTLALGTDYKIESPYAALVQILNVATPLTPPFKAAYSYGASTNVSMLTSSPPVRYLYMEAINTVDGRRALVHLYKVQFDPMSQLPLTSQTLSEFTLSGATLIDSVNTLNTDLGGFGRIEWLDEVT